jgi:hypothetical protein
MNGESYNEEAATSLSMIDCGVKSLRDLPIKYNLTSINLHSNLIAKIENLIYLQNLAHLDLSSNRITKLDGLSGLVSLRSLNLSCNAIATIENLDGLKQLVHLNLSYNKIQYVNGLSDLWGRDYRVEAVILNGNFISSLEEVSYYLSGLVRLRHVTLADNKFLKSVDYRAYLLTHLKSLVSLDGRDRLNKKVSYKPAANWMPDVSDSRQGRKQPPVASFHVNNNGTANASHDLHNSQNELSSSVSSLGPKLDVVEDKIHALLRIRDKIKHNLSCGEEDESGEDDEGQYAVKKYNELTGKKVAAVSSTKQQSSQRQPPKGILKVKLHMRINDFC